MRYANPLCLALLTGLLLSGCASQTTKPTQFSGYLADYSQLQPATSATGAPVLRWISPQFKSERYSTVLLVWDRRSASPHTPCCSARF